MFSFSPSFPGSTFLFTFAALFCATAAQGASAPTIVSVTQSGSTFSISGTAFGTKATAAPLRYDNFEDATAGQGVSEATGGYWLKREGDAYPEMMISAENQRNSHSNYNASAYVDDDTTPIQYHNNVGFSTTGKIFVSYWMRPEYDSVNGMDNALVAYQQKTLFLAESIDGSGKAWGAGTNMYTWIYPACTNPNVDVWYQQLYSTSNEGSRYFPNDTLYTEKKWYHVIRRIDQGTPGNQDGEMWDYIGNATGYIPNNSNGSGKNWLATGEDRMDAIMLMNYLDLNPGNAGINITYTYSYDDIYLDNSWATVWVGNAPTYDACTRFELQIPTSWTATAITAEKVMGNFADGDTAYVYVMNEDGEVNAAGYEITLADTVESSTFPWSMYLPALIGD